MADIVSRERRSWNMARIKGKDTSIEIKVRKYLFSHGFRYRKNVNYLPGKPDIVLPKYRTVIFVHGCFWHRHPGCKDATIPKTRTDFWQHKFDRNVYNDKKNKEKLIETGWRIITVWECEIEKRFEETMNRIETEIKNE
ncbi:DNA mismatch endonuclease Vsr [Aristaeella lactis]|uniref:T/G mismatch-specific endonuclease n=1 Tax=Aristaeella lactis TaxID=3046383 RepID=A0AC61PL53_9FIRM|nr:DNA mismatch endonuclease Vsr [Aristaeella lactis]SMC58569.1 T/G mismatch-specific endonuclease [Aristaeella lactis]